MANGGFTQGQSTDQLDSAVGVGQHVRANDPGTPRWALVRHGQTAWNEAGRLQGRSDVRLNARGREQAVAAGRALAAEGQWDLVVCSPLNRARQTALIIADQLGLGQVAEIENLVERDFGSDEGSLLGRLPSREREALLVDAESERDVVDRAAQALHDVLLEHAESKVVVVCHGTLIRLLLDALADATHPHVENGQMLELDPRLLREFVQR